MTSAATESHRVYTPAETGGLMTVGELAKHLAELPQGAAVFFAHGDDVYEEGKAGLTAEREAVETVETIHWHKAGECAVGYVRLVGKSRFAAVDRGESTWAELFPQGRTIFYEGDDPEGFRRQIKDEFAFDVADLPGRHIVTGEPMAGTWGKWIPCDDSNPEDGFRSYSFHCPAKHLDAIYGSDRFPMGS
jgi:hypothetical protein